MVLENTIKKKEESWTEVKRSEQETKMVKEPQTTCQEAGKEECDILRIKGERLTASNASIKRRNEKETLDLK